LLLPALRDVDRLAITVVAGVSIVLGYRLFSLVTERQGRLQLEGKSISVKASDFAPGIFFALFGAAVLVTNLILATSGRTSVVEDIAANGSVKSRTTSSEYRNLNEVGAVGSDIPDIDYDNINGRIFDSAGNRNGAKDYVKLVFFRNLLRSTPANEDYKRYWKTTALQEIKTDILPMIIDEPFQKMTAKAGSVDQLHTILSSYVPYYYSLHSKRSEQ
jgi:hypothetical protein